MGWEGGSSLDNDGTPRHCQTGWVRQARREGVREEPARESPSNHTTSSNLADLGWVAVRTRDHWRGKLLDRYKVAEREAVRNVCGVRTAMLQGQSWAPNPSNGLTVNMGTTLVLPNPIGHEPKGGNVRRPPMAPGWGGGPVVVRGRESRPHGEGVQRVRGTQATREGRR